MSGPDAFRRELARRLSHVANARRQACAEQPTGSDLKIIGHCRKLASSAETLDPRLCAEVEALRRDESCRRRFATLWDDLPETIGIVVWPNSAAELVAWMVHQADHNPALSRRDRAAWEARKAAKAIRQHGDPQLRVGLAVATDFTGALAVVSPMLAVWETASGFRQYSASRFAASHPSTPATIVTAAPAGGRGSQATDLAMVAFAPSPGMPVCHAKVRLPAENAPGDVILVVPRSPDCEQPLVVADIGDPVVNFSLALAFLATGLVSLKCWSWLWRNGPGQRPRRPRPLDDLTRSPMASA